MYDGPYVPDGMGRQPDHFGSRTSADLVVVQGPCVDNHTIPLKLTGWAKIMLPTGESYEGDWVCGKRHGSGRAIMPDGSRYQGEWKAGTCYVWGAWERGSRHVEVGKGGGGWRGY